MTNLDYHCSKILLHNKLSVLLFSRNALATVVLHPLQDGRITFDWSIINGWKDEMYTDLNKLLNRSIASLFKAFFVIPFYVLRRNDISITKMYTSN
jgi:hypothetical protein